MRPPFALVLCLLFASSAFAQDPPLARTHDNELPEGRLIGNTLDVRLVARESRLFPEAEGAASVVVPAFGIDGGPPEIPGPFLRVKTGTIIHVTLRNDLTTPLSVHGLRSHREPDVAIEIANGQTRDVTFVADEPGLHLYWGSTGKQSLEERDGRDGLLNGLIRVESGSDPAREEAIFAVQHMGAEGPPTVPAKSATELWLVNGKMWPHTKAIEHAAGKPIVWRWLNASNEQHPMHLHGSYFELLATGTVDRETIFRGDAVARVVTHVVRPGESFLMRWQPPHPGNWLFHCHIVFHTSPDGGVWTEDEPLSIGHSEHQHMSGLVVGTRVTPAPSATASTPRAPRGLTLDVVETGETYPKHPDLGELPKLKYSLPMIVLERGQPVAVTIRNQMKKTTTVHWHGIELESYFDGVPGYGGNGSEVTPEIPAGGSFVARFTPPRAGTFMFHTHMHDYEQLSTGLYGALIVLPRGQTPDPEHDRVFLVSRDGPDDRKSPFAINGSQKPETLHLKVGQRYRFRFINITPAHDRQITLTNDGRGLQWMVIAKDGTDLPAPQRRIGPAMVELSPGETCDVEFVALAPASLRLRVSHPRRADDELAITQSIVIEQ